MFLDTKTVISLLILFLASMTLIIRSICSTMINKDKYHGKCGPAQAQSLLLNL